MHDNYIEMAMVSKSKPSVTAIFHDIIANLNRMGLDSLDLLGFGIMNCNIIGNFRKRKLLLPIISNIRLESYAGTLFENKYAVYIG